MKKIIFFLLIFVAKNIVAQNKQVLYDFAELPQTLLLNPAFDSNYKFHVGVPLMSQLSVDFGSSSLVLTDLFALDHRNINTKISEVINSLSSRDFLKMNTQIEVLNAGFRLNDKTYLSFGFYEEIDAIGYYPKDFFVLFSEGNHPHLNRSFSASQIMYSLDVFGVLHAGISRKMNEKFTVGGRLKIYSSSLNLESKNNTGTLTTIEGSNNLYTHYFNNVNVNLRTSGLVNSETNEFIEDGNSYLKNTFFGSNMGLGIDVGFIYKISDQLEVSASILDFGYIKHSTNVKNTKTEGNFIFEGVDFTYDSSSNINYWEQLDQRIRDELPTKANTDSYVSWQTTKFNAALKYSFGEQRSKYCYQNTYKDFYTDAFGVHLYSEFRPLSPLLALTAFYQKSLSNKIHAKVTYTVDDYSLANIGAGFSVQLGKVNLYGMLDNILEYTNLSSANRVSLQMGINVIFN